MNVDIIIISLTLVFPSVVRSSVQVRMFGHSEIRTIFARCDEGLGGLHVLLRVVHAISCLAMTLPVAIEVLEKGNST